MKKILFILLLLPFWCFGQLNPSYDTVKVKSVKLRTGYIISPKDGYLYYDGSHFYGRIGAYSYQLDQQAASSWLLNGNILGAKRTLGSTDNYAIGLITNDTERVSILGSGKVGIGTTSPSYGLDIRKYVYIADSLKLGLLYLNTQLDSALFYNPSTKTLAKGKIKIDTSSLLVSKTYGNARYSLIGHIHPYFLKADSNTQNNPITLNYFNTHSSPLDTATLLASKPFVNNKFEIKGTCLKSTDTTSLLASKNYSNGRYMVKGTGLTWTDTTGGSILTITRGDGRYAVKGSTTSTDSFNRSYGTLVRLKATWTGSYLEGKNYMPTITTGTRDSILYWDKATGEILYGIKPTSSSSTDSFWRSYNTNYVRLKSGWLGAYLEGIIQLPGITTTTRDTVIYFDILTKKLFYGKSNAHTHPIYQLKSDSNTSGNHITLSYFQNTGVGNRWHNCTGTYASTTSFTFSGNQNDCYKYAYSLFKCLSQAASVTAKAASDYISYTAHGHLNSDICYIISGTAPGGLALNTPYFIINKATDSFKVSATPGGSAIDITSAGTSPTLSFLKTGYINGVPTVAGGTITANTKTDYNLASGDNNFMVTNEDADKTHSLSRFLKLVTIPGEIIADVSNPQGMWYSAMTVPCYLIRVDLTAITAASGAGAACAINCYDGATALFSSAPDLTTNTTLTDQIPTTKYITTGNNFTMRVTSSAGASNKASDLQVKNWIVPINIFITQ